MSWRPWTFGPVRAFPGHSYVYGGCPLNISLGYPSFFGRRTPGRHSLFFISRARGALIWQKVRGGEELIHESAWEIGRKKEMIGRGRRLLRFSKGAWWHFQQISRELPSPDVYDERWLCGSYFIRLVMSFRHTCVSLLFSGDGPMYHPHGEFGPNRRNLFIIISRQIVRATPKIKDIKNGFEKWTRDHFLFLENKNRL